MDEHIGKGEDPETGFVDEAKIDDVLREGGGQALLKSVRIEARADEFRCNSLFVEERDGDVEFTHLGLVRERICCQ